MPAGEKAQLQRCYGLALAAAGKYDDARKKLRGAADGGASSAGALAFVEAMAGKSDAALAALGGARDPAQRANLGLLLWSIGRGDEARPHLEAAQAAAGPTGAAARAALADLALRRGEAGAAANLLESGLAACKTAKGSATPDDKLCAFGRELAGAARLQLAQAELARALRADAPSASLRQLADELVAAAPAKDPRRPTALYLRGTARLLAGDESGAAADFQNALEEAVTIEGRVELRKKPARQPGGGAGPPGQNRRARRLLEAQREPVAQLDLGILLDNAGKATEALPFYLAYLQSGGERRKEVEAWVARLKEVSP